MLQPQQSTAEVLLLDRTDGVVWSTNNFNRIHDGVQEMVAFLGYQESSNIYCVPNVRRLNNFPTDVITTAFDSMMVFLNSEAVDNSNVKHFLDRVQSIGTFTICGTIVGMRRGIYDPAGPFDVSALTNVKHWHLTADIPMGPTPAMKNTVNFTISSKIPERDALKDFHIQSISLHLEVLCQKFATVIKRQFLKLHHWPSQSLTQGTTSVDCVVFVAEFERVVVNDEEVAVPLNRMSDCETGQFVIRTLSIAGQLVELRHHHQLPNVPTGTNALEYEAMQRKPRSIPR